MKHANRAGPILYSLPMTFRGWRSILGGLELAATAALLKLTDFGRVPRCLLVFAPFPRVQVPLASPSWIATTPRTVSRLTSTLATAVRRFC